MDIHYSKEMLFKNATPAKTCLICLVCVALFVYFLAFSICSGTSCFDVSSAQPRPYYVFNTSDLDTSRNIDFKGGDILVYLHIQKTGGTSFSRQLVHNLDVHPPCKCTQGRKICRCLTSNKRIWLFSRHSTGWKCGLHADWTELHDCVDEWFQENDVKTRTKRRFHYVTFLRHPRDRFLSEWHHVRRGATWKNARLHCNGRDATREELPFCYHENATWTGVSFDDFASCKHNLASNRMTRMLAYLTEVNCYNKTGLSETFINSTLLKSAKRNLLDCAFFGILDDQRKTQFLFEHTFGIHFIERFEQREKTQVSKIEITKDMVQQIKESNTLDYDLYEFAKELFLQRVSAMEKKLKFTVDEYFTNIRDKDFKE